MYHFSEGARFASLSSTIIMSLLQNGRFLQMIFTSVLAVALLASIVDGKQWMMNELLDVEYDKEPGWSGVAPVCYYRYRAQLRGFRWRINSIGSIVFASPVLAVVPVFGRC